MAVGNSLTSRIQKQGLTAYLAQDAVKNQINSIIGGKNGARFISSIVSAVQATPRTAGVHKPQYIECSTIRRIP